MEKERKKKLIKSIDLPINNKIYLVSDPIKAQEKAINYLGEDAILYEGTKNKKYKIFDKNNLKWVNFGDINYKDFTFTNNLNKRNLYLLRAKNIKGDWVNNPYSPNNLSIHILW